MKIRFFLAPVLAVCIGCAPNGTSPLTTDTISARVRNATDRGPAPANATFDLVVGVRMRDLGRMPLVHKLLADNHDTLSPEEFGDQFAVSRGEYFRVVSWLKAQGLEIVRTSASRTTVTVRGNAAALQTAFNVEMRALEDARGTFIAPRTSPFVSNEMIGDFTGVIGIDGSNTWESHLVLPDAFSNAAGTGAQTPSDLSQRYNETLTAVAQPGKGQKVAILSTNEATLTTDLNKYLTNNAPAGVTTLAANQYTQVFVGGPSRDPNNGAYVENVLDAEMVLATAPFATIVQVFTATNGGGLFADGISYIVNNQSDAHVVTVSWGTCERGSASEMPILNALFAQARAEGQQWFFASGDTGSDGCRDGSGNKVYSAGWPASSPYVVGVGGTQTASATTENAWNGAGGGPSETLDKPAYQAVGTPADSSRDEPDVSAIAGGNGVSIVSKGSSTAVLGTSAATPIWAGIYANLLQAKAPAGKGITTALESFYTIAKAGHGFHDITTGTQVGPNGTTANGYAAAVGYDMVTGWGTPNLNDLIANWQ
jgi:kumamolisin